MRGSQAIQMGLNGVGTQFFERNVPLDALNANLLRELPWNMEGEFCPSVPSLCYGAHVMV